MDEFRKLLSDPASCIQLHDPITLRGLIFGRFLIANGGITYSIYAEPLKVVT